MRSNRSNLQGAARGRGRECQEGLELVRDGETSPAPCITYVFSNTESVINDDKSDDNADDNSMRFQIVMAFVILA